jgi:hypothetical protein
MNIVIQAADLDAARVDGTRVYLRELLRRFGTIATDERFTICHKGTFNPELAPPELPNYSFETIPGERLWMQTGFARRLFELRPDKVFIPLQAVPVATPQGTEIIATVHDLAFRYFPKTFPVAARAKLNLLLGVMVRKAGKIIAVSEATKLDLIKFFPDIPSSRIRVIHHGVNADTYSRIVGDGEMAEVLSEYGLERESYALYVGAIQPRKNLIRLVSAFEAAKAATPGNEARHRRREGVALGCDRRPDGTESERRRHHPDGQGAVLRVAGLVSGRAPVRVPVALRGVRVAAPRGVRRRHAGAYREASRRFRKWAGTRRSMPIRISTAISRKNFSCCGRMRISATCFARAGRSA